MHLPFLFADPVMPYDIIPLFKDILLIGCLKRIIVMNHIRNTIIISFVRYDSDVILKDHYVSALPLADLMDIYSEPDRVPLKISSFTIRMRSYPAFRITFSFHTIITFLPPPKHLIIS